VGLRDYAKELRRNQTDCERNLWLLLRDRRFSDLKFRRQQTIGPYIVDFVCLKQRLIVELDGGQHADQAAYDKLRDAYLTAQGFRVLRFWNNEVLENIDGVAQAVLAAIETSIQTPHPNPLPQGERA
jgi:very-short-patch-repair endonuclease